MFSGELSSETFSKVVLYRLLISVYRTSSTNMCSDKNISIATLSERSGLSESQIDVILNSDTVPSLAALLKIARALGVRLGTFLDDSEHLGPIIHTSNEQQEPASFSSQLSVANSHLDFFALASGKTGRNMFQPSL